MSADAPLRIWPDAQQSLLLGAALGDGAVALADFARWEAGVDWDGHLDHGSFRLLPLLHANLARLGCEHALMKRLGGVYRHSWAEAQGHVRRGALALAALRGAGIPVLVSKGLLLATAYYDSPALRPMSDIDLLIPGGRELEALAVLEAAGWSEFPEARAQWGHRRRDMLALTAAMGLHHPRLGELDLHWRLLHESTGRASEAPLWRDARPVVIGGVAALQPSPTHLLLHVVTHGLRPNVMSPLRWIADAAMILRREAVDWDELRRCGQMLRVERRLASGLAYLRDEIGLDVPADAARPASAGWVERCEEAAFEAGVGAARGRQWLEGRAAVARLLVGDGRRHLPRIAVRWAARRLLPAGLVR